MLLQPFLNAHVVEGKYTYMKDLHSLQSCHPKDTPEPTQWDQKPLTPLRLRGWKTELENHPDQDFKRYILGGIQDGFRIGFQRPASCQPASSNMAIEVPAKVQEYLHREVKLGRMVELTGEKHSHLQISPIGLIPKKYKPGKWRLIVDLSSPDGSSVNDGIDTTFTSLKYTTVDHLAEIIATQGSGSYLVKADIKEAFRIVPVHPDDRWLLAIQWEGTTYIDLVLPFGLRSAPKIFSALADALQWIMCNRGVQNLLHYLDDFICVSASLETAGRMKDILLSTWDHLGVPIEADKLEGPDTCMTFLGIEVDTTSMQLRLPNDKLYRLKTVLETTKKAKSLTKRNLQHMVGLLQHATKVIRPGRAFMRRLHVLSSIVAAKRAPHHFIRLNVEARADILWWYYFVERWNGVSILSHYCDRTPEISVTSDAAGNWGCGAHWLPHWFVLQWDERLWQASIQVKELIPVVIAAALYGKQWAGKLVEYKVDNQAVVDIINKCYSKEPHLMHLVRLLVFFACFHKFEFVAMHIPGKDNTLADAISRGKAFESGVGSLVEEYKPSEVPNSLVDILAQNFTWTTNHWLYAFDGTLQQLGTPRLLQ